MGLSDLIKQHKKQMGASFKEIHGTPTKKQQTGGMLHHMMTGEPLFRPPPKPKTKPKKAPGKTKDEGIFSGTEGMKRQTEVRKRLEQRGFRKPKK